MRGWHGLLVSTVVATLLLHLPGVSHSPSTTVVGIRPVAIVIPYEGLAPAPGLAKWDTRYIDPTASWPDSKDPTWSLSLKWQEKLACVRWHESRNHLTSINLSSDAEGWYQFTPYIWKYARSHFRWLPATPLKATGDEQSFVAMWYLMKNQSLKPEWSSDAC
jgi:hypothetical protein